MNSAGDIYLLSGPGIRKISSATGIITTLAGARGAILSNGLSAFGLDSRGYLYAAEINSYLGFGLVQQVNTASGAVTTIAGRAYQNPNTFGIVPTPGPATQTPLPALTDVTTDASGNVYIATPSQISSRRCHHRHSDLCCGNPERQELYGGWSSRHGGAPQRARGACLRPRRQSFLLGFGQSRRTPH